MIAEQQVRGERRMNMIDDQLSAMRGEMSNISALIKLLSNDVISGNRRLLQNLDAPVESIKAFINDASRLHSSKMDVLFARLDLIRRIGRCINYCQFCFCAGSYY